MIHHPVICKENFPLGNLIWKHQIERERILFFQLVFLYINFNYLQSQKFWTLVLYYEVKQRNNKETVRSGYKCISKHFV